MDTITLKLDSKQMDIVANALGMRPYVEVAQLLQAISQQIQQQQQGPQQGPQEAAGASKPNGAALAPPTPEVMQ